MRNFHQVYLKPYGWRLYRGTKNISKIKDIEINGLRNDFAWKDSQEDQTNTEIFLKVIISYDRKKHWEIMDKSGAEVLELVYETKTLYQFMSGKFITSHLLKTSLKGLWQI